MKQSTSEQGLPTGRPSGIHLAIIMDGNGRWATQRRRARTFGHRQGAEAVRRVVKAAPGLGIGVLTLYAFSSDNWSRPPAEVRALMRLLHRHLLQEAAELADEGVRLRVIGRRDRLSPAILHAIRATEERTRAGERLLLRVAVDYSARSAIVAAAAALARDGTYEDHEPDRACFERQLGRALGEPDPVPDVDLLIRTGGERRLSDFLLWECAYAELYFSDLMWPEFGGETLAAAVADFRRRERRFGRLPGEPTAV